MKEIVFLLRYKTFITKSISKALINIHFIIIALYVFDKRKSRKVFINIAKAGIKKLPQLFFT